MHQTRILALAFWISSPTALIAKPVTISLQSNESSVEFNAKDSLNILKFKGTGTGIVGQFKITDGKTIDGSAIFKPAGLSTGLEKRDEHMRDHLEVNKFTEAKFVATSLPWNDPSEVLKDAVKDAPFTGKITIHGVEKAIEGTVSTTPDKAGKVQYSFNFKVLLTDFDIKIPSFMGVKVDNTINVIVKTLAQVEVL